MIYWDQRDQIVWLLTRPCLQIALRTPTLYTHRKGRDVHLHEVKHPVLAIIGQTRQKAKR